MVVIYDHRNLLPIRRHLRKRMTAYEVLLWQHLRVGGSFEGHRFRRQESIGRYVADFYCSKARLVIEVDGGGHFTEEGRRYDKERDEYMKGLGLTILRFTNSEVKGNLEGVLGRIGEAFKNRGRGNLPCPSSGEEGTSRGTDLGTDLDKE